jgi:2-polyprenyl-3-methyl-5-hydroxy-6-metoxy-1,4-benzoquinol methylase
MDEYRYKDAAPTWANTYLWPAINRIIAAQAWTEKHAFDLGCGNGATANMLSKQGFEVTGVDTSESGVALANKAFPDVRVYVGDAYDDLAGKYGTFPLVVSLEVIEHCIDPRRFAKTFFNLLAPSGIGIISTPYHGYLKNVAISLSGKWDFHHSPLSDGGHVKFFSRRTLRMLLEEAGFENIAFGRVGRVPPLAKSMIATVQK